MLTWPIIGLKPELRELSHFLKCAGLQWVKSNKAYATLWVYLFNFQFTFKLSVAPMLDIWISVPAVAESSLWHAP